MIELIANTLESSITGLNFIARYGGFARPVTAIFEGREEGQFVPQTFPIATNLSASQCFEGGKYRNLVPNDAYLSVAYIEQLSTSTVELGGPKRNLWAGSERIRFVCWLNYPKMGVSDVQGTELYELKVIESLLGERAISSGGILGSLEVRAAQVVPKSHRTVFGRYSYAGEERLFLWPYDFFAVDFTVRWTIQGGCLPAVSLGAPITCVTSW